MKTGDTVYCIKTNYNKLNQIVHLKGKIDTLAISEFYIYVSFSIESEGLVQDKGYYGYLDQNMNPDDHLRTFPSGEKVPMNAFSHHFITFKEYRKQKLEKLNESSL